MNIYVCAECNTEISQRLFNMSLGEKNNHTHVLFIHENGITKIFHDRKQMNKKLFRKIIHGRKQNSCTILDNLYSPNDLVYSKGK